MAILGKPKEVLGNLSDHFVSKEFQVAVNNKTFKILIDKLYTNKVQAIIRELSTNAYDAHVMAGCADRPFKVSIPTALDPTFVIRDFGVSLDHEDVMNMYVTIFESTKENTNEQVGAFGLGSKSPFCYTDSFSVKAYKDGKLRCYVVGYTSSGIPSITHISTEDTEEETGFEVSFPAEYKDYATFRNEAYSVLRHFPTPPIINEVKFDRAKPILEAGNWKVYKAQELGTGHKLNIRQGCVVYPVNSTLVSNPNLAWDAAVVIDVPIGSVNVAASREALSLDDDTVAFLNGEVNRFKQSVKEEVLRQFNTATTLYDAIIKVSELNSIVAGWAMPTEFKRPGMNKGIDINGGVLKVHIKDKKMPTLTPYKAANHMSSGGYWYFRPSYELKNQKFIIDRGQKMVRRTIRLNAFMGNQKDKFWIVHDPTSKQLERLVRRFQLKPHQVIGIESLPDIPPMPKNGVVGVGTKSGVYKTLIHASGSLFHGLTKSDDAAIMSEPYYWLPIEKGVGMVQMDKLGRSLDINEFHKFKALATFLQLPNRPLFFLTKNAVKRVEPPEDERFDIVMSKLIEAKRKYITDHKDSLVKTAGLSGTLIQLVLPDEWKIQQGKAIPYTDPMFANVFRNEILLRPEVRDSIGAVKKKYPLLFMDPDRSAMEEYVKYINSKEKS